MRGIFTHPWRSIAFGIYAAGLTLCADAALYDVNNGINSTMSTQSGWIAATSANGVTYAGVGASVDSRARSGNTNDPGADTANGDMWRDFIFANGSSGPSTGLDITISGLLASTDYNVRLWGWDDDSNGGRTALWNGNSLTFGAGPDPTSLNDYVVSFTASTNGSGVLVLQGRAVSTGNPHNVFVNGFELVAVPEPSAALLGSLGALLLLRRRRD